MVKDAPEVGLLSAEEKWGPYDHLDLLPYLSENIPSPKGTARKIFAGLLMIATHGLLVLQGVVLRYLWA
jgi:hypothetical protein